MPLSLGLGPVGPAARKMAVDRADSALASLDRGATQRPEKAVHDARKRCKEIRAVLRFVRPGLDEETYRTENELFRDASRILSPVRDAQVMVECFDELVATVTEGLPVAVGPVSAELRRRAERVTAGLGEENPRIAEARDLISAGRTAVSGWQLDDDWTIALAGMTRIYRQGRRGLARSAAGGGIHDFHDWRKRVKYLWYHVQMIADHDPDLLHPFAEDLQCLSDALGEGHDLHMLAETVQEHPERYGGGDVIGAVGDLAKARRVDLERRALALGARVYADAPRAFKLRIASYVDAS